LTNEQQKPTPLSQQNQQLIGALNMRLNALSLAFGDFQNAVNSTVTLLINENEALRKENATLKESPNTKAK
jgi:regulator of replication initiation timing